MPVTIRKSPIRLTEKLLHYYGKFIGLCPFTRDEFTIFKFSFTGMSYGLALIIVFAWIFFKTMESRVETKLPGETTMALITNCLADFFKIIAMCVTWMIFALRQKRIFAIFKAFAMTSVTARKLGIVEDERERDRLIKKIGTHAAIVNLSFFCYTIINFTQLRLQVDFKNLIYFVLFNVGHVICRNLVIIFVDALIVVRKRFSYLNEATKNLETLGMDVRSLKAFPRKCKRIISLPERIEIVGQLHRQLTELAEMIRDFCSPALLIIIALHFVQLVVNFYIVWILSMLGYRTMDWQDFLSFMMAVIWLAVNFTEPFVIANVCDSTCKEARRTGIVLHETWNERSCTLKKYAYVIDKVSLSLLQNQLNLTIYDFLELDLTLMHKIVVTMTTYIILIMQLDEQEDEKAHHSKLRSSHHY